MTEEFTRIASKKTFLNSKDGTESPMYILIRNVADLNMVSYKYFHYVPQKSDYAMRVLLRNEALYIDFLRNHNQEEFYKLFNSGRLYKVVTGAVRKAEKAVEAQVNKWELVDRELLLAKKNGNMDKYYGLLNNLKARAEEAIFPKILFR